MSSVAGMASRRIWPFAVFDIKVLVRTTATAAPLIDAPCEEGVETLRYPVFVSLIQAQIGAKRKLRKVKNLEIVRFVHIQIINIIDIQLFRFFLE